ncbi:MAG: sugar phosphate isomerase/epimerase family protein [Sphaerochaeta sp.]|jgi:3-dehydroshikimate dehydratase
MIIPGLVSVTCKDLSIEEIIDLCNRLNLKAIEWSENWHIDPNDLRQAKNIHEACRAAGIEIVGYGSYFFLGEGMDILPSLKAARAIGAPIVRIWGGKIASYQLNRVKLDEMITETQGICDLAREFDLTLAMEWHKNSITDRNESAISFLESVNHPSLKTLWQPTQALTFEERVQGLRQIQTDLAYLHTYYWDERGRCPLSEGEKHWKEYFDVLKEDQIFYALLEFVKENSINQLEEDARTLRMWIDSYDKERRKNGKSV